MFRFENPEYLYLLILIPILALIRFYVLHRQKQKLRAFGDLNLVKYLMPDVSIWRPRIKFWLLEFGLSMLIIAIARPQMGIQAKTDKRVGIETIIALDISNSMLAEDVKPSRLVRSKMLIENLIDKFTNDKVGLIVFAGDAFVQLPITSDFVSAKMFLNTIEPSLIATQGTDIATAINMASHSFTKQEGIGKAIIVITDGEDHEGGANEAAQKAREKGMTVYVLGIGTSRGAPIPLGDGSGYIKDERGEVVLSALNEAMCKEIANSGGGSYIQVNNNSDAQKLLDIELSKLSKNEISSNVYTEHGEQFQIFCFIAILFIVFEMFISERKTKLFRNIKLFEAKRTLIIVLMVFFSISMFGQYERHYVRSGNKKYNKGNYSEAEIDYRKAIENGNNPQATYNLGNALLMQKKDSAAIRQYEDAARIEKNSFRKAKSYHNIGVICQNHQMYSEAIEAYKNALRLNPNDDETRYNLEICKRQAKQQKKDSDNKQKSPDNKKDDKKDTPTDKQKQENKNKQDNQEKPQKGMSKDNAEQLLNAVIQQEKNAQQKMKKAMQQPRSKKNQKNW